MIIPKSSGIYFVRLSGDELSPIDLNPKRRNNCIKVNALNSKFGQAQNLASRFRSYQRTFGDRVDFKVLLLTKNTHVVERDLKSVFSANMLRGQTNRLHEWLHGIDPNDALRIAEGVCAKYTAMSPDPVAIENAENRAVLKVERLDLEATDTKMASSHEIIAALEYLQGKFFSKDLLVQLHHSNKPTETLRAALDYFRKHSEFRRKNNLYGNRLIFVAKTHQQGEGTMAELTDLAIQMFPNDY